MRRKLTARTGRLTARVSQYIRSPDSGYEPFGPCHVRRVFVAERLDHHPFLCTDTKGEENSECDKVRRSCNPVRNDERLPDGVNEERGVHWMSDITIDSVGYESMVLTQFKSDRPVPAQVGV